MDKAVKTKIEFEVSQLDIVVQKADVLVQKCKVTEPDYIELCASASMLHSYYNGLESIFNLIAKGCDGIQLSGTSWHKDLLNLMFEKTEKHLPVLSNELKDELIDYMGFRHFFRHAYGHFLDWTQLKPLFINFENNWEKVKSEIKKFVAE